jgi:hypothetical protein
MLRENLMAKVRMDSMRQKVEAAFEKVAAQVVLKARQTGTPVIVWEDGRVKALSPEAFELIDGRIVRKKKKA